MTAQFLTSELGHLIQDSKRKNQDLKQAAESSLSELKALPATSEKQITSDISRRPQFINPFLIACSSKNPKYAGTGMSCLQRLAVAQALPKSRLKDILDAMTECSALGLDVQLKILQTLPALLQNYAEHINGSSFFTTIQICSTLQASKTSSVSSTSAATLQQLVNSLYEKLAAEDRRALELPTTADVSIGTESLRVRTVAFDAYRFLNDLCLLVCGEKPQIVRFSPTSEPALLELVESIFTGHAEVLNAHKEQAYIIKTLLIPYLVKSFTQRSVFPVTIRVIRVLYLIAKNHLLLFPEQVDTILRGFQHGLDQENAVSWKRILCMEVFREIFTDVQLVLKIQLHLTGEEDSRPILPDCLASFVRLATEKPALIGLGQYSTVPIGNYFQRESTNEQTDANAAASGSAGVPTAAVPGISIQFSHVRSPCIEQLDKAEPPMTPETYIYSLVLACLNNLAESLSKFILPLTLPQGEKTRKRGQNGSDATEKRFNKESESTAARLGRKRTVLLNPLQLESHPAFDDVKAVEGLLDSSWHAILACCSTFFHAALDAENYRILVRSFQKYTQVAGLLQMDVPRDAFLTTLGKNAMPPNLITATAPSATSQVPQTPSSLNNIKDFLNVDNIVSQASSFLPDRRRHSLESNEPVLTVRNFLCLRALLNLAIALGPVLDAAWAIIFETLQHADRVLAAPSGRAGRPSSSAQSSVMSAEAVNAAQQMSSETAAVQSATSRLLESTADLSDGAFVSMLQSLCALVRKDDTNATMSAAASPPQTPHHKRRLASFSGLSVRTGVQEQDFLFVLTKLREIATLNMSRFVVVADEAASGWQLLLEQTTNMATDLNSPATARLLSVDLIRKLVVDTIGLSAELADVESSTIYARALMPIRIVSSSFRHSNSQSSASAVDETAIEAHVIVLTSLQNVLEHIGDDLLEGWTSVLEIIASCFRLPQLPQKDGKMQREHIPTLISIELGRAAFASLQLICSDFLNSPLDPVAPALIDLLHQFNAQEQDLNMSLTTTTFFWNVSDFLYTRVPQTVMGSIGERGSFHVTDALRDQTAATKDDQIAILWLYLVQKLSGLIVDTRDEVRNGVIHTTLRIFDNNGEETSPAVWQLFFDMVLLPMLLADANAYTFLAKDQASTPTDKLEPLKARIGTTQILLDGLSDLMSDFLDPIIASRRFPSLWEDFIDCLRRYTSYHLHNLNAAVFKALHTILNKAEVDTFPQSAISQTTSIWDTLVLSREQDHTGSANLNAFEAYVTALTSIYRFRRATTTIEDTERTLANLEQCVGNAEISSYTHDMDTMTTLQELVLKAVRSLRTDLEGATAIVIKTLAHFIGLPLQVAGGEQPSGQTYIALSKASMPAIENIVSKDCPWSELFDSNALQATLESLEQSVRLKYHWSRQGRRPALWQKATSAALSILDHAVPELSHLDDDDSRLRRLWEIVARITYSIANADHLDTFAPVTKELLMDEQFDIDALKHLVSLVKTPLGRSALPDSVRRSFTRALFTASLIHPYKKTDLPDLEKSPLDGLYAIRYGRTTANPPCARQRMSYVCFDLLLSLLSGQESTPQQVRLAKAAAPYVILRGALPLRSYIADQPLRDSIPVPMSLETELVTVLNELCDLRCEPAAIPATSDAAMTGGAGAHLVRLFPLVRGAVAVDGPPEIKQALNRWLEMLEKEI